VGIAIIAGAIIGSVLIEKHYVSKTVEMTGYLYENNDYCPSGTQCPRGTYIELTSIRILDEGGPP
jgi:hypothetical protein